MGELGPFESDLQRMISNIDFRPIRFERNSY